MSAILPGNHEVKVVTTSRWHRLQLAAPEADALSPDGPAVRDEVLRGADKITSFPLDGAHYYCETMDITRPFPSDKCVGSVVASLLGCSWAGIA